MDSTVEAPKEVTQEETRRIAVKAWYDADTREKKQEVVKQYPFLTDIFSAGHH